MSVWNCFAVAALLGAWPVIYQDANWLVSKITYINEVMPLRSVAQIAIGLAVLFLGPIMAHMLFNVDVRANPFDAVSQIAAFYDRH